MKSILEEFFYGNISPITRYTAPGSAYEEAMKKLVDCESALLDSLPDDQKLLVTALTDAQGALNLLSAADRYVNGFRAGALMTMDIFHGMDHLLAGTDHE